uniref:WW domain-containing protein n=1 Tax=viral metagenome TaxID=1070528 RepID=A0A6C0J7X4_9ZZZZ
MNRVISNKNYEYIISQPSHNNPLYLSDDNNKYDYIEDNLYSYVPESNLPHDWRRLYDHEYERYYYVCDITKHTQWLNPTIPIDKIMSNNLPYTREEKWNEEYRAYYYINHVAKYTTRKRQNLKSI